MVSRTILRPGLETVTSVVNYNVTGKNHLPNYCEERIFCYLVVLFSLTDKNMKSQCRNHLFFSLNFSKP